MLSDGERERERERKRVCEVDYLEVVILLSDICPIYNISLLSIYEVGSLPEVVKIYSAIINVSALSWLYCESQTNGITSLVLSKI